MARGLAPYQVCNEQEQDPCSRREQPAVAHIHWLCVAGKLRRWSSPCRILAAKVVAAARGGPGDSRRLRDFEPLRRWHLAMGGGVRQGRPCPWGDALVALFAAVPGMPREALRHAEPSPARTDYPLRSRRQMRARCTSMTAVRHGTAVEFTHHQNSPQRSCDNVALRRAGTRGAILGLRREDPEFSHLQGFAIAQGGAWRPRRACLPMQGGDQAAVCRHSPRAPRRRRKAGRP